MSAYALRPAWTPLTIALMVIGFIVFPPLGLVMLAYILWGDQIPEVRRHFDMKKSDWRTWKGDYHCGPRVRSRSGNVAFDDYRAKELQRLEEERRRLDEELKEFERFMADLRRARDEEEFRRFRTERDSNRQAGGGPTGPEEARTIDL